MKVSCDQIISEIFVYYSYVRSVECNNLNLG